MKLKKIWDELQNLVVLPICTYGVREKCNCGMFARILDAENRSRLMQFLMHLNSDYDVVKSQILATKPLLNVNKAYQIVLQVEKQKQVTNGVPTEPVAFMANQGSITKGNNSYKETDGSSKGANAGEKRL